MKRLVHRSALARLIRRSARSCSTKCFIRHGRHDAQLPLVVAESNRARERGTLDALAYAVMSSMSLWTWSDAGIAMARAGDQPLRAKSREAPRGAGEAPMPVVLRSTSIPTCSGSKEARHDVRGRAADRQTSASVSSGCPHYGMSRS